MSKLMDRIQDNWMFYGAYKKAYSWTRRLVFQHKVLPTTYAVIKLIYDANFIVTVKFVYGSDSVNTLISHWTTNVEYTATDEEILYSYEVIEYFFRASEMYAPLA